MVFPPCGVLQIQDEIPYGCDVEVSQGTRKVMLFEVVAEVTQHPGIAFYSSGRFTFGTVIGLEVLCQLL